MLRSIAAFFLLAIAAVANAAPNVQIAFQNGKAAPIGNVTGVGLDVTNYGSDAATNVVVTYTPAAQLTYVTYFAGQSVANPDPTVTESCTTPRPGQSGTITCTISTLPPNNKTVHFFFSLNVPASIAPGTTLTHTASTATQTISFSNKAEPMPQLVVSHTYPSTVVAGAPYDYTIAIRNASSFDATNVYFDATTIGAFLGIVQSAGTPVNCLTRDLPDAVRCDGMTIPAGDTIVFSVTAKSDPSGAGFLDDVDITVDPADFFPDGLQEVNPVAFETAYPDPAVTITAPAKATVNTPYTVHVSVYAAGPSSVKTATLTFPLPAGTTFNSVAATPPPSSDYSSAQSQCATPAGGPVTCTMSYLVPPYLERDIAGARAELDLRLTPTATGGVTQTATVSSPSDLDATNDSASATTTVVSGPVTDLAVSLQQQLPLSATDPRYTATVTNRSSVDAGNEVLTLTFPSGVTSTNGACSGTPLVCTMAGTNPSLNVQVHVPSGTPSITVNANVSSTTEDANPANNTASVTSYFGTANGGDLTVTASAEDAYGTPQPLPAAVPPGTPIVYNVTASNVPITVTIPSGSTFVVIEGGTVNGNTLTAYSSPFTVIATAPATPGTYVTQVAMTGTPRTVTQTIVVSSGAQIPPAADLSVRVDAPLLVQPGDNASYAVSVLNRGASPATNVRLTVTLPSGAALDHVDAPAGVSCSGTPIVCSAASLANGATLTVNVVVRPPALPLGTLLPLSASATSDTPDGSTGNNRYAAATTVAYPTRLAMRVDPPSIAVAPNAQFVTTVTVTNNGQSAVSGLTIGDVSPFVLKVISATPSSNATCTHSAIVSCNVPVLNPGEQAVITAVLQAPASGTVTQKRFVYLNAVDAALAQVRASQTVVTTAHPKHRAAP